MSEEYIVDVDHLTIRFNMASEKVDNLKEYVIKLIKHELMFQEFWALRDISFEVQKGDRVGIMGLNGAGKSTLLKVISGVLKATQGTVTTNGKIAPLLELGAGFDRQYTGAENIYLYGAMLGYDFATILACPLPYLIVVVMHRNRIGFQKCLVRQSHRHGKWPCRFDVVHM